MKKIIFGLPQLVVALIIANILFVAYLASDINYNRVVNQSNQKNIIRLVNETQQILDKQGNFSNTQRNGILHQFMEIQNHGGFATKDVTVDINDSVDKLNNTVRGLDLKLDKLLNQTK